MNSRERVFTALDFCEPDRVPRDFWGSPGFYASLKRKEGLNKEDFLDANDIDLRYIDGPRYIGPPLESGMEDVDLDIWHVPRRKVRVKTAGGGEESYSEVANHPLADASGVEDVTNYPHWPSPDWFDYTCIRSQCEALRNRGRVVVFMGDRLNRIAQLKPAMYLRGIERIFLDLAASPDIASAIFFRIHEFYREYLMRILEAAGGGIDIVLTGDDFGTQNGLLLSPAMWHGFLSEGFSDYNEIIHSFGARAMHHSCGAVAPLVPDMVEGGLNILQSLQPEAMSEELSDLKGRFRASLGFHGGMSIQQTLPHGTPQDVRKSVKELIEKLAGGGGYIFGTAHNVQADCPLENVYAMLEACDRFGRYD